ncbi:MAG: hypothetical protein KGR98_13645, partial [Verrucomicrobia bacterium]|nr:hypothetical protein [Verrucomicrobiota bacterium]
GWAGHNLKHPGYYGFTTNSLRVTVVLNDGKKCSVEFGLPISGESALASVKLDHGEWAFIFPPGAYQLVSQYLTLPARPSP